MKMNFSTIGHSRLASVTASITRAVPATLICHMRSRSRIPVRTASMTNARCTTAMGRTSRNRLNHFQARGFQAEIHLHELQRRVSFGRTEIDSNNPESGEHGQQSPPKISGNSRHQYRTEARPPFISFQGVELYLAARGVRQDSAAKGAAG